MASDCCRRDSNPGPLDHEQSMLTNRPETLQSVSQLIGGSGNGELLDQKLKKHSSYSSISDVLRKNRRIFQSIFCIKGDWLFFK